MFEEDIFYVDYFSNNPGSRVATENGCTCSAWDNRYGKGIPMWSGDGPPGFFVDKNCPIHGDKK